MEQNKCSFMNEFVLTDKEKEWIRKDQFERDCGISIQYSKPWKPNTGTFGVRFEDGNQYVHLLEEEIRIFIPFTGSEKKCWNCKGDRILIVYLDLDGRYKKAQDTCNNSMKVH